ncbi:hypothetical protein Pcinc_006789 [Petrolisthes cinctipes]|uniref:Uncharacterized protein n=1 Tax=Petrolisthes cinctipes TaxID=88211 RepID=A0AAE1GCI0_PETCI|nr:hypothetical protein Pcinc_006789 [Petrolisthes cinctipes]
MLIKRLVTVTPTMKQLNDHLDKMVGVPRRTVEYHGRRATSERQNAGATKLPDDYVGHTGFHQLDSQTEGYTLPPLVQQTSKLIKEVVGFMMRQMNDCLDQAMGIFSRTTENNELEANCEAVETME